MKSGAWAGQERSQAREEAEMSPLLCLLFPHGSDRLHSTERYTFIAPTVYPTTFHHGQE
jgi:hypothetical protein